MSRKIKAAAAVLSICMFASALTGCSAGGAKKNENQGLVNVQDEMYGASYWSERYKKSQDVLMTKEDIIKFNAQTIAAQAGVEDISYYKTSLNGTKLASLINEYELPQYNLYSAAGELLYEYKEPVLDEDGNPVESDEESFASRALANRGSNDIRTINNVSYGLAIGSSSIRRLPAEDMAFASPANQNEDVLRAATLSIGEPVIILYTSADSLWYFVQTRTCRGWVLCDNIVQAEKSEWLNFIHAEKFLVVTDRALALTPQDASAETVILPMGTMLPLAEKNGALINGQSGDGNYIVNLPIANENGGLSFRQALIPMTADVSVGYMDFTSENIVRQALKLAGQKLNPAGLNGGWDADTYIASIYSCFGITLPCSAEQLRTVPAKDVDLTISSVKDSQKALDSAVPGSLLFTDKGAAVYLGKENNRHYALAPFTDFFIGESRYTANSIIITDMDILFENGSSFLSSVKLIKIPALLASEEE